MSTASAPADRPSIGWLATQSLWMLATVIPGGVTAWAGFLFVGIAGRMPRWIVCGTLLGTATIVAHLDIWAQFQPVARSVVYISGMLLALWANPQWLTARWQRVAAGPSMAAQRAARGNTTARAYSPGPSRSERREQARRRQKEKRDAARLQREAAEKAAQAERAAQTKQAAEQAAEKPRLLLPRSVTSGRSAASDSSAATRLAAAGASTAGYFAAASDVDADPVDVNTAGSAEIASLPGLNARTARRLVTQRDKIGGWGSLDAFAAAANLQPHEIVRLRTAATCSPRPRGPRTFGRRVDY